MKKKTKKKDINYYMGLKYIIEVVPIPEEDGGDMRPGFLSSVERHSEATEKRLRKPWLILKL